MSLRSPVCLYREILLLSRLCHHRINLLGLSARLSPFTDIQLCRYKSSESSNAAESAFSDKQGQHINHNGQAVDGRHTGKSNQFLSEESGIFPKGHDVQRITQPVTTKQGHIKKVNSKTVFRNQFKFASQSPNDFSEESPHRRNSMQSRDESNYKYTRRGPGSRTDKIKMWPSSLKDIALGDNEIGTDLLDLENVIGTSRSSRSQDVLPGLGKRGKTVTTNRSQSHRKLPDVKGEMLFGLHPVSLALRHQRRQPYCLYIKGHNLQSEALKEVISLAEHREVPVKQLKLCDMDQCANYRPHQGVCLDVSSLKTARYSLEENAEEVESLRPSVQTLPLWLVLYQVQDPMNFGAILRSAYLFGVNRILVTKHNSCSLSPVVSKASTGALEVMDIYSIQEHLTEFIQAHQQRGWAVLGTACGNQPELDCINTESQSLSNDDGLGTKSERCVPIQQFSFEKPTILIVGNEGAGLPDDVLEACDQIVYAELMPRPQETSAVDSLNVSVATGILLHWLSLLRRTPGE